MSDAKSEVVRLAQDVLNGVTLPERDAYRLIKAARDDKGGGLQPVVARLLDHPIELVRQSALDAIVYGDRAEERHLSKAIQMLRFDSDAGTRAYAAVAVAALSRRYGSQEAVPALIEVLRDAEEHTKVRLETYTSLLSIAGAPASKMPHGKTEAWDPDRDIDWDWVRSLEDRGSERVE